ncbi:MAG: AAA family ATPase [Legionella sp.]
MSIKTLSIQGYRSIQNMRLSMENINVIVGANGCGKSNLYKAIH